MSPLSRVTGCLLLLLLSGWDPLKARDDWCCVVVGDRTDGGIYDPGFRVFVGRVMKVVVRGSF